ncbi:glycine zipper family protein [Micromonospora sp. PLK6-60]|uniref:glycine zipper family protein n=1 Tax=Micromonospora sp. PLK6-60 TaxID=2873383 RepID=UPI001CA66209|nr:glycine zipper family protein [Micromonospora sp. PLK6-60]MBY8870359.1 glycine zipper family protein [Micromonospora sp. PLK6-60]
MVFGIVTAAVHSLLGGVLGGWLGGPAGVAVGGAAGLLLGVPFGWAVAGARSYRPDARGVALFVVDHTWSLPNTVLGAGYLVAHLAVGHRLDRDACRHRGRVNLVEGVWPRYATTLGTVCAGAGPGVQRHEDVHILQARLLGPLYLPLVAANYVLFTIAPVWLLYHDHARAPIDRVRRYFEVGVYPHTWHEAIAYRVQGRPPR